MFLLPFLAIRCKKTNKNPPTKLGSCPECSANTHKSRANTFNRSGRVDYGFTLVKGQRDRWRLREQGRSRSPGWSVVCRSERCLLSPSIGSPFIASTSLRSILAFHRGTVEDVRVSVVKGWNPSSCSQHLWTTADVEVVQSASKKAMLTA